jgi:hypothetical protein
MTFSLGSLFHFENVMVDNFQTTTEPGVGRGRGQGNTEGIQTIAVTITRNIGIAIARSLREIIPDVALMQWTTATRPGRTTITSLVKTMTAHDTR